MLKYIYTLATLLDSKSRIKKQYSTDTVISDLFDEDAAELYWILSLSDMELIYGFEIPDELFNKTDLTLGQYAYELSKLPLIPDSQYEEFFDIKFTSMKLTKRYIELETKNDADSVLEMKMIKENFQKLDERLNNLLGNKIGFRIAS